MCESLEILIKLELISSLPFSRIDLAKFARMDSSATFFASSGSVGPTVALERNGLAIASASLLLISPQFFERITIRENEDFARAFRHVINEIIEEFFAFLSVVDFRRDFLKIIFKQNPLVFVGAKIVFCTFERVTSLDCFTSNPLFFKCSTISSAYKKASSSVIFE